MGAVEATGATGATGAILPATAPPGRPGDHATMSARAPAAPALRTARRPTPDAFHADENTELNHPPMNPPRARWRLFPLVTAILVASNVAVWLWQILHGVPAASPSGDQLIAWGADLAPLTLTGDGWRLVTSMFLHFGIVHLALNMYVLWFTGPRAEHEFGSARMLLIYLAGGLLSSCASVWWSSLHTLTTDRFGRESVQLIVGAGASGAVMALFGGLLAAALLGTPGRDGNPRGPTIDKGLIQVIAINLATGLFIQGVDQAAHVGGFLGGCAIGAILGVRGGRGGTVARLAATALLLAACLWALFHGPRRDEFLEIRQQLQQEHGADAPGGEV